MKIGDKCYDEFPVPPDELRPLLDKLYAELLDDGYPKDDVELSSAVDFFIAWWEEVACTDGHEASS